MLGEVLAPPRDLAVVRGGAAVVSGALLAAAFPGTGSQGWLAFGALIPLIVAIDGGPWPIAAALGGAAGLTFWVAAIPWIAPTLARHRRLPWVLASAVLLSLAGYLACDWAVFCAVLSRVRLRSASLYVVFAASLWVALEDLRTFLLTGFPWNLLGYSQYENRLVSQIAAVTGVYGVSFVVVAVNVALARGLLGRGACRELGAPLATAGVIVAVAAGYAWLGPRPDGDGPSVRVALVQGDIDQGVKWDPAWQDRTLGIYEALTRAAAQTHPLLVVWPETAVPFVFDEDPRRAEVAALARASHAYLLTGAPESRRGEMRNSTLLIAPDGRTIGRYDKRHLVPFGEYVPRKPLLRFVNVLAGGAIGEFTAGQTAAVFPASFGEVSVVICYEGIFPAEVREFVRAGAGLLVNIPDDAWFGRSAAPAQHLAMAAFRAIENRRDLIRAANTGV